MNKYKQKREAIPFKQKLNVIQDYLSGLQKHDIACKYKIKDRTIIQILRNRDKIIDNYGVENNLNKLRIRTPNHPDLDKALFEWVTERQEESSYLDEKIIREQALALAAFFRIQNFKASKGWLKKFIERHKIQLNQIKFETSIPSMVEPSASRSSQISREMSYRTNDLPELNRHISESHGKQNYEDIVTCMICYDMFDSVNQAKLPKILPCQHTYCVECIKNLMHSSPERNKFSCPQCKFQADNVKDPVDLPTSRIVLSLLEKDSLNFQGYASCPSCRQIRNLEVCFECNLPLCLQCITKHFETWKQEITQSCIAAEQNLETYKQNIDKVNPQITNNFENIQMVKDEIEDAFNILVQRLRNEKDKLLKTVSEIKDENAKYVNFKKEIVGLITSFKMFRESNENFDKKTMISRMKKRQIYFDQIPKIEKQYNSLIDSSFRILKKFDKKPLPDAEFNFMGNLILDEVNLAKSTASPMGMSRQQSSKSLMAPAPPPVPTAPMLTSQASAPPSVPATPPRGAAPIREHLRNLHSPNLDTKPLRGSNVDLVSKWALTSQIKPQSEITIPSVATYMAAYANYLFTMDQTSFVSVYEKAFSVELKLKNSVKLNLPNVRAFTVNSRYLAVAYAAVKKEQMKGSLKSMNSTGILLFGRDEHVICSVFEKQIEIGKGDSFKNITSLAMNEMSLFAADRDLKAVYQFDLSTSSVVKKINMSDGMPTSLSLNQSYLMAIDALHSILYVFDLQSLELVSSVSLKTIDQLNGALNGIITEENLIFVRNSEYQITLLDNNLEPVTVFNEVQAKLTTLAMIREHPNQMIAIGGVNSKSQYKIFGYTV